VSIDDFGQGHTSLGYLSTLPLHELKIDKSFVADLPVNAGHAAIVRSIVELGHNLGLQVVAEGVETDQIVDVLAAVDCDIAQGYLLARPMPPDQLPGWLCGTGHRCRPRRPDRPSMTGFDADLCRRIDGARHA
jgi:EAL domain-containing protein (putative c-di-GMP-specific phosphodiesterase class I)